MKLSCECSMISKHTAFIAIDEEQKEPVKGSLQTWDMVARPSMEDFNLQSKLLLCCARGESIDQLEEQCSVFPLHPTSFRIGE